MKSLENRFCVMESGISWFAYVKNFLLRKDKKQRLEPLKENEKQDTILYSFCLTVN